jgi:hypothetical protein
MGTVDVSPMVMGGNAFSGFALQGPERDREMIHYTGERTMEALAKASPHHVFATEDKWDDGHRDQMVALIRTMPWPVVHYKVFAGGNKPVDAGSRYLAGGMRPGDAVCIWPYLGDYPDMPAQNVRTFDGIVDSGVDYRVEAAVLTR